MSWEASALNSKLGTALQHGAFLNGKEAVVRQPSLTMAFCNTSTVLSIIHDALFSDSALNHEESTPVCLLQEEPRGRGEKVCMSWTHWKACFRLSLEKNRCPVVCGEAQRLIVWMSAKMAKWSWWMRRALDGLVENFQVKTVCLSLFSCMNLAPSNQAVITSSDKISFSLVAVRNFSTELYFSGKVYSTSE